MCRKKILLWLRFWCSCCIVFRKGCDSMLSIVLFILVIMIFMSELFMVVMWVLILLVMGGMICMVLFR